MCSSSIAASCVSYILVDLSVFHSDKYVNVTGVTDRVVPGLTGDFYVTGVTDRVVPGLTGDFCSPFGSADVVSGSGGRSSLIHAA